MKKVIIIILFGVFGLTSCNTIKTLIILKKGKVEQRKFKVNIPFEYRLGLIVLKVSIEGKEYDFILDTGTPNVISKELAQNLNINSKNSIKAGDSQGGESDLGFISIGKISIGGINFLNTGAAIVDFTTSKHFACSNVDGLIGANLMKNAIWKFDYQNQIITISNSLESIDIPEQNDKIPFHADIQGTPIIDVIINSVKEENVLVDLGSNGDIKLYKETFNKLVDNDPTIPRTVSFGSSSYGINGIGAADSIHYALIPDISFGDVALKNTVVKFTNKSSSIGTNYFKNYDLIINWFDKEIILIKKKEYDNSGFFSYGFSFTNKNDSLIVSEIYDNSSAANEGLKINDIILKIDDKNYGSLSTEQWCNILEQGLFDTEKSNITFVVLRDKRKLTFNIEKTKLL